MSDKQFELFALVIAIALAIWYFITKKQAQSQMTPGQIAGAFPASTDLPTPNTGTYMPPTMGQVELNIKNPGFNMLTNQYIPLFGFTGMAQGTYYG